MFHCEDCGGTSSAPVVLDGVTLSECLLCGALHGDDAVVARAMLVRQAEERGFHPALYPLVVQIDRIDGLCVLQAEAGEPGQRTWPFVQLGLDGAFARSLENLAKSIALSNVHSEVHWVLEVEYQRQLVVTLKPRFHRGLDQIGPREVIKARADLQRVAANLERDMALSWWRR